MMRSIPTCLLLLLLVAACTDNSLEPTKPQQDPPVVRIATFHGVWHGTFSGPGTTYISIDTLTSTFRMLIDYGSNLSRELEGQFVADSVKLNYVGGSWSYTEWYRLSPDTLITCYDSTFKFPTKYVRTDSLPSSSSWLSKVCWTRYREVSGVGKWILGMSVSDSGTFVLTYPLSGNSPNSFIVRIDSLSGIVSSTPVTGIQAIEASDSTLWTVSNLAIEQHRISDMAVLKSIPIKADMELDGIGYSVNGMAVNQNGVFIVTSFPGQVGPYSRIFNYQFGRGLYWSNPTSSLLKDLALMNGRLFCSSGSDSFHELNFTTGESINNFYISGYKTGVSLSGIAFYKNKLHLANENWIQLRLFETTIPGASSCL